MWLGGESHLTSLFDEVILTENFAVLGFLAPMFPLCNKGKCF